MPIYLKYFYNTCKRCNNQYIDNVLRNACSKCFDNKIDVDVDDIQEDIDVKPLNILDDIDVKPLNILDDIDVKSLNILEQLSKY